MFGSFPDEWLSVLRPYVQGQHVVDLGTGDGQRAERLLTLEPASLLLVDKEDRGGPTGAMVRRETAWFQTVTLPSEVMVAHVAWPQRNGDTGLAALVKRLPRVIFVGRNTGGTCCGSPKLFMEFLHRPVLECHPRRENTLIVYGERGVVSRTALLHEECGGLCFDQVYPFDDSTDPVKVFNTVDSIRGIGYGCDMQPREDSADRLARKLRKLGFDVLGEDIDSWAESACIAAWGAAVPGRDESNEVLVYSLSSISQCARRRIELKPRSSTDVEVVLVPKRRAEMCR